VIKRVLPVLCLFVLSPLIAEYLSGSLPVAMLTILPLMAAMYGSGAVLIREFAVRSGGGWPAIVLLAAAYGFVEEGWVDQSLFNPNYQGLRLLDYGYVEALGTGLPWMLYVIAIHVVWSIATPIALTNALFPERRREPYLAWWGIALFALLYLAANTAVTNYLAGSTHFFASPAQLVWAGGVVAALLAGAWLVSRRRPPSDGQEAPPPWRLFLLGFVPGALLTGVTYGHGAIGLPWPAAVAIQLLLAAIAVIALVTLGRKEWNGRQRLALTAGLLTVYLLGGFLTSAMLHGPADLPGHAVVAALCLAALGLAWRRAATDPYQGISLPS
jgi:hypothetical protein